MSLPGTLFLRPPPTAPPERLAAFRIILGAFVVSYLVVRMPVFLELGTREPSRFDPAGAFQWIDRPFRGTANTALLVMTLATGVAFTLGWRFRVTGPVFAVVLLLLTSHRSSWGQLLHFENLMVLHVITIAGFRAADAWSLDVRRRNNRVVAPAPDVRYGFPLQLASVVVVVTYVIAGVAKLRYGGLEWLTGDSLRNHIAYSATRVELLGGRSSPLAASLVSNARILRPIAAVTVLIELAAPLALIGRRFRNVWVASAWFMHLGVLAFMFIGFPSPLLLVAFAPMFDLEHVGERVEAYVRGTFVRLDPS